MQCPNCGSELPGYISICPYCGYDLRPVADRGRKRAEAGRAGKAPGKSSGGTSIYRILLIVILSVSLLAALGLGIYLILEDRSPDSGTGAGTSSETTAQADPAGSAETTVEPVTDPPVTMTAPPTETEPPTDTEPPPPPSSAEDPLRKRYAAYWDICQGLIDSCGTPSCPVSQWPVVYGLSVAELVDFDGDGLDELLVCYSASDDYFPESGVCEIWGYKNDAPYCILSISDFDGGFTMNSRMAYGVTVARSDRVYLLTARDEIDSNGRFTLYHRIYWVEDGRSHSMTYSEVGDGTGPMDSFEFYDWAYGDLEGRSIEDAVGYVQHCFSALRTSFVVSYGAFGIEADVAFSGQELVDHTNASLRTIKNLS